jgi:hypothetical protein
MENAKSKFRRGTAMKIKSHLVFFASILLFTSFAGTSFAAKGEVVYKKSGCDYFIVETNMGYALLEWYGGNDPDEGDIVVGNFESYGFKDIYNLTANSILRVWVEDYWLSKEEALEQYFEHCD